MLKYVALGTVFSLVALGAQAGTLIPVVPVPGSTSTYVGAINDKDVLAGHYTDSQGSTHAFTGTLDGNYITFDAGVDGTIAASVNDDGYIMGESHVDQSEGDKVVPFERFPDGTIVNVTKSGKPVRGFVEGINVHGTFVGWRAEPRTGESPRYFGKAAEYRRSMNLSNNATLIIPHGINRQGTVVGWADPPLQGFVLQNGITTFVRYPDDSEGETTLEGINDKGLATGVWTDREEEAPHAFLYDVPSGSFTPFDVAGATYIDLGKPNNAGFFPVNTDIGTFIYCPKRPNHCPAGGQQRP